MTWLSGGDLHAGAWTSSNYPGFGVLFENLPTTGESGGSPLLNDGGVNGDEVRWELISDPQSIVDEFYEDGSVVARTGVFTYRSFANNSAIGDFDVTITPESAGASYSITCETVSDVHSLGDVTFVTGPIDYTITCEAVIDTHSQGNVILRYSLPSDPIDYGMSSFGHNTQWRKSQFFRGF